MATTTTAAQTSQHKPLDVQMIVFHLSNMDTAVFFQRVQVEVERVLKTGLELFDGITLNNTNQEAF